jgi:hypothetical protein
VWADDAVRAVVVYGLLRRDGAVPVWARVERVRQQRRLVQRVHRGRDV